MEKTLVSLVDINGDEVVYRVPLEMFSPKYQPNGVAFKFNDLRIDWKRSYVEDFSITYMGCTFNPIKMSFYFGVTLSDSVVK
jgi:CO dehydrogenase/acetyl-CoA synthase gamma subunit (corrinoid Fe-S protein)